MGKKGDFDILNQIKKILKMERKMEIDTRGKEGLGRTSRRKVSGLVASVLAALIAVGYVIFPGKAEKDYAKLQSGQIVYFQKPVASVKVPSCSERDVYEIDTDEGKRYIESFKDQKMISYDKKTKILTEYSNLFPELNKTKLPSKEKHRKTFKTIKEIEEYLKEEEKKIPLQFRPEIFLSR